MVDQTRLCREILEGRRHVLHVGGAPGLDRVERARADERESRRGRPADVDEHRVAERGAHPDELAALEPEVGEIPVEAGLESRSEARRHVGREHGGGEEDVLDARLPHHGLECVDPRLGKRLGQRIVLHHVHGRGAERARLAGTVTNAAPEHDPGDVPTERGRFREDAEAALREVPVVGLEIDEERHGYTSLFSAR